jgi:hypothetical protein
MSSFRPVMITVLMVLGVSPNGFANVAVAAHATQGEVNLWKQRTITGPYKEGWFDIRKRADAFVRNPEPRWAGKADSGCYNRNADRKPTRIQDRGLRDAGFVYLVTGNSSFRNAVLSALLAQAATSGTEFNNSTKWCGPRSATFEVANWVRRLVYGYSYIRISLSDVERTILDNWFLNAGIFFEGAVHANIRSRFPNRLKDNYSPCIAVPLCPGKSRGLLHFGGPTAHVFSQSWANQPATITALVAAIGVVVNNATLKDSARRFVQEWLKFAVWPDGTVYDQVRWNLEPAEPQMGYAYAGTAIASIITIADHLARVGDTSLYEFSTNEGMFGTQGGPKSLSKVLQNFAGLTNGTILRYASHTETTNPTLLIRQFGPVDKRILYITLAQANIFYNRADFKAAYMTPLPSRWKSGGYDARGGDWGSFPDVLFMFAQREGAVWPYLPREPESIAPSAPKKIFDVPGGS